MKEIESELHGHLEAAVLALLRDPTEYDCFSLYYAMKVGGANSLSSLNLSVGTAHYIA